MQMGVRFLDVRVRVEVINKGIDGRGRPRRGRRSAKKFLRDQSVRAASDFVKTGGITEEGGSTSMVELQRWAGDDYEKTSSGFASATSADSSSSSGRWVDFEGSGAKGKPQRQFAFPVSHGFLAEAALDDVLSDVRDFLTKFPTEFVLLYLRFDNSAGSWTSGGDGSGPFFVAGTTDIPMGSLAYENLLRDCYFELDGVLRQFFEAGRDEGGAGEIGVPASPR